MGNTEHEWILDGSGIVVRRGDLVEYEPEEQGYKLAAMVVSVSTVGYAGFGSKHPKGTQLIAARRVKNRRLPKPEDLADTQIASVLVTRRLNRKTDQIPLPPPVAKTRFSPFDQENPWYIPMFLTPEEWKAVSRWYGYSLRSLLYDGSWHEMGRFVNRDGAYSMMQALTSSKHPRHNHVEHVYVIIHCTLQGKEGREQAVVGTPGTLQAILQEREQRRVFAHQ
ncbi:hypothetical protein KDA_76380 [Dictyobacter alpinus]|uniref:Uncharacterized protein n=1 Tax=Dictyobacter alpinus TaxID=2014873 RepID=A0A402BLD0_9CHLR|nr:hypothetical protein [Dictyobacter alpinus]GCE32154.1 hypothetical protein KDA_76380 [Dictyobacter alpinus]